MELNNEGENGKNRETGHYGRGTTPPTKQQLNTREMLMRLNNVLSVEYRGERLTPTCALILAIICEETGKEGFCEHRVVVSQAGRTSNNGIHYKVLFRLNLISRQAQGVYHPTAEGELLIRSITTDLNRILLNKPTKRFKKKDHQAGTQPSQHPWYKNAKGLHVRRPMAPIETFNELVNEVLCKKGLNKKTKYVLLRALGMKPDQAKEAIRKLEHGKNTERIRPILKSILSDLASNTDIKP